MSIMEIESISKSFGGLSALRNVTLTIDTGEIRGLIGPNGAGKTTLVNIITGVYKPDKGQIIFRGEGLTNLRPHLVAKRGIGRTFQNAEPFPSLTVLENVMVGTHIHSKAGLIKSAFRFWGERKEEELNTKKAEEGLKVVGIYHLKERPAASLAFGQLRLLEIARSLELQPQLLLLDEPAGGMNSQELNSLLSLLRRLREERNMTIVLIEHNLDFVMTGCDRISVLDHGEIISDGSPSDIRNDPRVIEAYIGLPTSDTESQYQAL